MPPLLRSAARGRIQFHIVADPADRLPRTWRSPNGSPVAVLIAAGGHPDLLPDDWAILPWLRTWFAEAHVVATATPADLKAVIEPAATPCGSCSVCIVNGSGNSGRLPCRRS